MVTDWREAKPCIDLLENMNPGGLKPVMMVVICELPRQYENAILWAQSRGMNTTMPVFVLRGLEDPPGVLKQLLNQARRQVEQSTEESLLTQQDLFTTPIWKDLRQYPC